MLRQLYSKLLYTLNTDFRRMIQNNHTKNCDKIVRHIEVAQEIWGKNIYAIKGNGTCIKPNPLAGDMINISKELIMLYKRVFLTVDIFLWMGCHFYLNQLQY